jgi:hypothetical protein
MRAKALSLFLSGVVPIVLFCSQPPRDVNDEGAKSVPQAAQNSRRPVLRLVKSYENPVITVESPGAEGIKYGFEGGRALKIGKIYHLITTEVSGEPRYVKTRLGYWTSPDRIHWRRVSTLFESSGNQSGDDVRASLWGPMPVYNHKDDRWELFYVGYRSAPESSHYPPDNDPQDRNPYLESVDPAHRNPQLFYAYGGTIWRAVSRTKGLDGIGGPYQDVGIILKPSPDSEPWEGFMGTDSFFPFRVKRKWYGFYGSCHTANIPVEAWRVGLVSSPHLAGPWKRVSELNPVVIDRYFVENPIVTQVNDGTYVAVYNGPAGEAFGYSTSRDGIHWSTGVNLTIQPKAGEHWADPVRTPLGLIPEQDDTFTVFYTGFLKGGETAVGFVTLRLEYESVEQATK